MKETIAKTGGRARRLGGALLLPVVMALLSGCITHAPLAPHPTVVYAPHPHQADGSLDKETLREMYTASPDVDPDGLGPVDWIWDQSYMTLVVWPLEEQRQELARIAQARTEQQHREKLIAARFSYQDHLVFEGFLVGDFAPFLQVERYLPESIYLIDDRGEKSYPISARSGDPLIPQLAGAQSDFGAASYGYPFLVFPRWTVLPGTRSISLYFATTEKRIRFTWVFDPSYEPPGGGGPRQRRLWPAR